MLSLENTLHRLQVPHTVGAQPTLSSRATVEGSCSSSTLALCKTSPALQAAYVQHAGVRTTHKFRIFPSWKLIAPSWLTLRSPHPGGINPPPQDELPRWKHPFLPNRHSWDKNEAHHLPIGTKLPDTYLLLGLSSNNRGWGARGSKESEST